MSLDVAILAGGLATRLRPITETIPKSLVEVAGRPFVYHQLDYLRDQGVRRVVLLTGHLGDRIADAVGNGAAFGLDVAYSPDGPTLLGTGGAVRQALPLLRDEFFLLYGDSYLPIDFAAVEAAYRRAGRSALMTVFDNGDRFDKSNVLFEDGQLREYNKKTPRPPMRHIDYGLSVLSAAAFADRAVGENFDLADLYHQLSLAGDLAGHEVHQRFYEIGSHSGLAEAETYFQAGKPS